MNEILQETKFLMKKYDIRPNKSLGQNFLIDSNVLENIVSCSNLSNEDLVIEIGPGLGTLTKYLVEKAGKVICVELDEKMVNILLDRFKLYKNIEILHEDILKLDINDLISKEKSGGNIKHAKVVANLPYYITTPIIMKLLESKLDLDCITVMIQKEVADRLIAIPGQKLTASITYAVYYYSESEGIMDVPRTSFVPAPEVTSKVIKLNIRKNPIVKVRNEKLMFEIIKSAFMQRRKTLLNALTNANVFSSKDEGTKILESLGLDINIRPEKLTLDDFAKITNILIASYLKK